MNTTSIFMILIMTVAGVGGGVVNIALTESNRLDRRDYWKSIVTGVGAAFLMPVFLNTMSSKLLEDILAKGMDAPNNIFVFAAFCLLAAISSRVFIQSLSDKVFKEVREVRQEAVKATDLAQKGQALAEEAKELAVTTAAGLYDKSPVPVTTQSVQFPDIKPGGDLEDPWSSKFGGNSTASERCLMASITPIVNNPDWCSIKLVVKSTNSKKSPLTGEVQFYLHPTFENNKPIVAVVNGEATINIVAWGAFTVGAIADGGKTLLELDLSKNPDAQEPFKSR